MTFHYQTESMPKTAQSALVFTKQVNFSKLEDEK